MELKNYREILIKWKKISNLLETDKDLLEIREYIMDSCSFCREYLDCKNCLIDKGICAHGGWSGLIGAINTILDHATVSNFYKRLLIIDIVNKIIDYINQNIGMLI